MPVAPSRRALAAAVLLPVLVLGACATAQPTETEIALLSMADDKVILPASRAERDTAGQLDLLSQATFWGREHEKNPNEYEAALKFSQALRGIGSSARAAEVSGQALAMKPGDADLTLIHAQASLDTGRPEAAASALASAEANAQGDWRMLSIIGVTMDQLGRHAGAQDYYKRALVLSPDNSRILSNLGLSYALEGKAALAEQTLRLAADLPTPDPRVKQNLAVVLGVQGKFDEAARISGPDMPKALVESNSAYYRALLSPARSWDTMRSQSN